MKTFCLQAAPLQILDVDNTAPLNLANHGLWLLTSPTVRLGC